jgi:hypothetical protein
MIGPAMAERLKLSFQRRRRARIQRERKLKRARSGFKPATPTTPSLSSSRLRAHTRRPHRYRHGLRRLPHAHQSGSMWFANGAQASLRPAKLYQLASTQGYQTMETPNGSERPHSCRSAVSRNTGKSRTSRKKASRQRISRSTSLEEFAYEKGNLRMGDGNRS